MTFYNWLKNFRPTNTAAEQAEAHRRNSLEYLQRIAEQSKEW